MSAMLYADYLIDYALKHDLEISNTQLPRILYVLDVEYMNRYQETLISLFDFEHNDYGPVLPDIYRTYESYGSSPITTVSLHEEVDFNAPNWFTPHPSDFTKIDARFKQLVDQYLPQLLKLNIFDIIEYVQTYPHFKSLDEALKIQFKLD